MPHRTLRLTAGPEAAEGDDVVIVLDPAWTADPVTAAAGNVIAVRDTIDTVLRGFDPIAETAALLDAWSTASGVVERLTIGSTSFWFYVRLRHWLWLQQRVLWAQVLRRLLDTHRPGALQLGEGADEALLDVAHLAGEAAGLPIDAPVAPFQVVRDALAATSATGSARSAPAPGRARSVARRVAGRIRWTLAGVAAPGRGDGRPPLAPILARVDAFAAEGTPRLLVVTTHAAHRVETPDGPRMMNPYLGSVADRLRGTRLEPIVIDWRAKRSDPASMARLEGPGMDRSLPQDAFLVDDEPADPTTLARAAAAARSIASWRIPVVTAGLDLGPVLAEQVSADALRWFGPMHRTVARIGRLLRRLRPAGILMADEYHRQDWREAAAVAGVPVAALQHGTINRHHRGYIHSARPPGLRLPDRTYVFGRWEHDRLVSDSVYREDEVVVAGSPRLDLFQPAGVDREAVRTELGIAPGDRLLVLSGTWGEIYRRFHYPVVLARLFDRPLPGVHLVVKQHPAETDEGPYRAVIEGVAAARGFAPPPITVVKDVDLYRLLGAADAHLGIHSTVLTEAVFVGTPNLLATGVRGGDLLDYVDSGVALPVTTGEDLLAALEAAAGGAITAEARGAFIARSYEPGPATERIAADLLAWLP
ncbi:MAG TPA: hypothetical protein VES19_16885 [Candidatus Limnocylindrales bacterium]|nr:hypothetical protein [Candidatus Limnocylindrales bacterium]